MPAMTDPSIALTSFQSALDDGQIQVQVCSLDPSLYVHQDQPNGTVRFTYARIDGGTVTALVILALCEPIDGVPCFQVGYAVPKAYRGHGLARKAVEAAVAELKEGLFRAQPLLLSFYIEAIIGTENKVSQKIAQATISANPIPVTDGPSGLPALQYVRKITR